MKGQAGRPAFPPGAGAPGTISKEKKALCGDSALHILLMETKNLLEDLKPAEKRRVAAFIWGISRADSAHHEDATTAQNP